jgi:hypothetical protein
LPISAKSRPKLWCTQFRHPLVPPATYKYAYDDARCIFLTPVIELRIHTPLPKLPFHITTAGISSTLLFLLCPFHRDYDTLPDKKTLRLNNIMPCNCRRYKLTYRCGCSLRDPGRPTVLCGRTRASNGSQTSLPRDRNHLLHYGALLSQAATSTLALRKRHLEMLPVPWRLADH